MPTVQNGQRPVTKQDLADFYQAILPYMGGMPEMVANKFSKGDLYSTDEKMIGQWIDGKPLYQKTITTTVSTAHVDNEYFGSIADTLFANDIEMAFVIGDKSYYNISSIATRAFDKVEYETDDKKIYFWTHYARTNITAHFTLQYTKTTDSPISIGNDTDYSTDEKIVGTWVDGKPLYQCTFEVNNPSTDWGEIILANKSVSYVHKVGAEFYRGGFFNSEFFNSTSDFVSCGVFAGSNLACRIKQAGNSGITKAIFIIQYTKSST